jgi:peptide/nickel transport system permease protein
MLSVFCFVAVFHNFLANDKYLLCYSSDGLESMVIKDCQYAIRAPIPYSPSGLDRNNRSVGPFDHQEVPSLYFRHWLGTDNLGRDVLAGLINGSYIALFVGGISSLMALIIGIFFAYWSGFIGDHQFRITKMSMAFFMLLLIIVMFYGTYVNLAWRLLIFSIPFLALALFRKYSILQAPLKSQIALPFDIIIFRIIEIFKSIPNIFIILILLVLFRAPGYWNVILIIALLRWPVITRHLRAEILIIKNENYILSARSAGLSNPKIFFRYVLPLTISPIIIVTAFGFSSAILLESTLSFLGIGVPADQVSWGSLLKEARFDFSSWWLAIFPGFLIYLIIYLFNGIGDRISDSMLGSNN